MFDLSGKVAVVTGASRGIGAAIAIGLAACGASVAVNYAESRSAAAEVVARITDLGGHAIALRADVGDVGACAALIRDTIDVLGGLDIVVNNAGIVRDGLICRMSDADWNAVIGTDLTGVFNVTRAAGQYLIRQHSGVIVNVASVSGIVGNAGQSNYSAAKAGVIGLTKSVAREFAPDGVRVNAVAPGFIWTEMTAGVSESVREAILGQIALGRFGEADDVAAAVAFLVSDEARYITGQILAIDGGMTFA